MAASDTARLTPAAGRKFAWTLAIGFGVLALIANWRGRTTPVALFSSLSVLLFVAGLIAPSYLGPVERAWMKFGLALSQITTPVFLGIVFFGVFLPVGLIRNLLGKNSVVRKRNASSFWVARKPEENPEMRRLRMERQF